MQRSRLKTLGPTFAQSLKMAVGRVEFRLTQLNLLAQKLSGRHNVTGHKDAERCLKTLTDAPVKGSKLSCAFRRELIAPLDFLDCELAQIFVNNVANLLKIDSERDNFHRPSAFALIQAISRKLG